MPNLMVLILLTIILFIWLNKILQRNTKKIERNYDELKNEYDKLLKENTKLKDENLALAKTAGETIALYDITKDICKYLDEEKLFLCFKEQLAKFISVSDCKFLKGETDLSKYTGFMALPFKIKIDHAPICYLLASGVKESEKEKFYILAHQFFSGIKRAFLYEQVQALAITDTLTGIFTRRYYLERLNEELERSRKFNYYFSFLMLDIDYFKGYNDRFGHLVGDIILKEISKTIKENIRQIDLLGRYGGEEFSIVLTETNKPEAVFVAQRIRQAVAAKVVKAYDEDLKVTMSIGISTFPKDAQNAEQLIEKADQALYRAKQMGRNRVCLTE